MAKKRRLYIVGFILILLVILILSHRSSPSSVPKGIGVSAHLDLTDNDIQLIAKAGIKFVRIDLLWSKIEYTKGNFDFVYSGYDELNDSLLSNGIRPFYILSYSNSLYEKNKSIMTQKGLRAFENYAMKTVSRYKNHHVIWEIWNEPNGRHWEPKPNYKEYFELVKNTSKIIKKNDPTAIIVAPGLAGLGNKSLHWLNRLLEMGILNYIDAISVHPYRNTPPETVINDYQKLREMIKSHTDKSVKIISGEWGYSTSQNGITQLQQSQYLTRMLLINDYQGVPISILYDWKNDGIDPNNGEQNFGLRENNVNIPKKAYFAIKSYSKILLNYHFYKRIDLENKNDYFLIFRDNNGHKRAVCWTTDYPHKIKLPNNIHGKILSMYGKRIIINNSRVVTLSKSPIYIMTK